MKLSLRIRLLNEYAKLARISLSDFLRYCKYACIGWNRSRFDEGQLEGRIIATYHVIEKGLSMHEFRPCFGIPMVKSLIAYLREGSERFQWCDNVNYLSAVGVVRNYMDRHSDLGIDLNDHFTEHERNFGSKPSTSACVVSGAVKHNSETYFSKATSEYPDFAKSRHSCRSFDVSKAVDIKKVFKAIDSARYAPSVCNRQCWRVHAYTDKSKVERLLSFQGGNRGFGHLVPAVLVITSSLKVFAGYLERNQAYIDGGLFSMSLMHGLHHQRLGCVPLCWLVPTAKEKEFRQVAEIDESEEIMMLMGIGEPLDEFAAPASQRRKVEEIATVHS